MEGTTLQMPEGVDLKFIELQEESWAAPLTMLLAAGGVAAVLVPCLFACLLGTPRLRRSGLLASFRGPVALVVAHPDDEAMFFWPTLVQLHRAGVPLAVLCLSTGNYDGLGKQRAEEMRRSCARLGVGGSNLSILDDALLQDGPHAWPEDAVAARVAEFVRATGVGLVLTFDSGGVSGHPNHISTSLGVCRAAADACKRTGEEFTVLMLDTVSLLTKYLGPLNLWLSELGDSACTSADPLACLVAMATHWSQLVWYRILSALFSRYTYVNTFTAVPSAGGSEAAVRPQEGGELRQRHQSLT
eukprot:TRINITY_DN49819_c0_g1_i1.p1 TRINITY_DN49819_c0_g1~~TRINITY_DN49819_c0_g1_i1.p1  ORF type:complete len:301 (+),score=64.25 TRINITY_DN49819_c0_g1_i1:96-998(+)